jgi:hypothetical protein
MGVSSAPATSEPEIGTDATTPTGVGSACLKTLYVAHAVSTLLQMCADQIDARLGGGGVKRSRPSGRQTSGLHRKHLRGEHAATPERLRTLRDFAKTRAGEDNRVAIGVFLLEFDALLWRWLGGFPRRWKGLRETLHLLPDDLFWSIHGKELPWGGRYACGLMYRPRIEVLVASGRADAVALLALYGVLLRDKDPKEGWLEAVRAVPAAIAVWSRRPGAKVVMHFVFARLRQMGLDLAQWNGKRADFSGVDLDAWAQSVPEGWPRPISFDRRRDRFGTGPRVEKMSEEEERWVQEHLAPVVEAPPSERWPRHGWPIDSMERLGLHAHFGSRLRRWLGTYWAPERRGHTRLRVMTDQDPPVVSR